MTFSGHGLARTVDDQLFVGPFVLIDRENQSAGSAPTRAAADAAVRHGTAATFAARIRDDVLAVDLDLPDRWSGLANYIVEELTGWAGRRHLVCMSRLSGGGAGRWHVYITGAGGNVLSEPTRAEFRQLLDLIREERRLEPRQLEIRRIIRPLTAPHRRNGDAAKPPTDLRTFAEAVSTLPKPRTHSRRDRPPQDTRPRPAAATIDSRARTTIEKAVRDATGDRSLDEFVLTRDLVNRGTSLETAWASVVSLGGKSAERGLQWWRQHIWGKVQAAPTRPAPTPTVDLSQLIVPTVAALRPRLLTLDRRQQHSIETVCWVVLERLQEHSGDRLPLSERDLELTTGLTRRTARHALEWLEEAGVLDHRRGPRRDDAKEWALGPSAQEALNAPPRLTPTARSWAPGCPPGTASHALDAHLPPALRRAPEQSTRQRALRSARAAACDDRQLLACLAPPGPPTAPPEPARQLEARRNDQATWTRCLHRVTVERDEFYTRLRRARMARDQAWQLERQLAFERDHARHRRWWLALSATDREHRRSTLRDRHRARPTVARAAACERLRRRRAIRTGRLVHVSAARSPSSVSDPLVAPDRDSGLTCS